MASSTTERFIDALHKLESDRAVEPLLACFAPNAALSNLAFTENGIDGARRFWSTYRDQFDGIYSDFSDVIESDGRAVLLWTSRGALRSGSPIEYRGASVLHLEDGRVARFETIYDSAAFVREKAPVSA